MSSGWRRSCFRRDRKKRLRESKAQTLWTEASFFNVVPAQAEIHLVQTLQVWVPACAGTTGWMTNLMRGPADELQHDLAAVRVRAVLDQIDALPGAEHHLALLHRHMQAA